MKISRYGSRQYQGGSKGSSERSAIFRKKYKVGEILKGKLLKWEREKLGWVEIEDQTLLANIQTSPSPGDMLIFVVQQLYPDIILKEITPDDLNSNGEYVSPTYVTKTFVSSRAAFEAHAVPIFDEIKKARGLSAKLRRKFFLELLEQDTKGTVLFIKTIKCAASLNSVSNKSKLYYMPWLIPNAFNQEIVLKVKRDENTPDKSFYDLLYAFDLPPSIPVRLRIMYKKPQAGFKVHTDDQKFAMNIKSAFRKRFPEFISTEKIPPHNAGGFLSELLGSL